MKNLIKSALALFIIAALSITASAANTDNTSGVSISAYVSDQISTLPSEAKEVLKNKLSAIVTQNGITNGALGARFIITPNISVMSKDIVAGPPPMHAMNLDITFYVGDGIDGRKFASKTISVKGVGTNENKAYIDAIKNIKPDNADINALLTEAKKKIMDYYNGNCDNIIKIAQAAAGKGNYEEAIATLTGVPDVCEPCYDKALAAAQPMYKKYIDQQCDVKVTAARSAWNAHQDSQGATAAGQLLSAIDPSANPKCYDEVRALNKEISQRMQELGDKEWAMKNKQLDANTEIQKAQINSNTEVAKSRIAAYSAIASSYYYSRQNYFVYNIHGWW